MESWLEEIEKLGFSVWDGFLSPEELQELGEDLRAQQRLGRFKRAAVGRGAQTQVQNQVRRDEILWFEPHDLSRAQARLWAKLQQLRTQANERLYLGLTLLEGHYAIYGPGGFYEKHLDQFQSEKPPVRVLSCVLYLNPSWEPGWGGQLRLYKDPEPLDVEPIPGRLVCFLSAEIPHQVLPTSHERLSFAGWFSRS